MRLIFWRILDEEWSNMEYTIAFKLRTHLEREQLKGVSIFVPVINSTGYDITKHTEGYFHTIMHVLMYSTGLTVFSELQNAHGRLDMGAWREKRFIFLNLR